MFTGKIEVVMEELGLFLSAILKGLLNGDIDWIYQFRSVSVLGELVLTGSAIVTPQTEEGKALFDRLEVLSKRGVKGEEYRKDIRDKAAEVEMDQGAVNELRRYYAVSLERRACDKEEVQSIERYARAVLSDMMKGVRYGMFLSRADVEVFMDRVVDMIGVWYLAGNLLGGPLSGVYFLKTIQGVKEYYVRKPEGVDLNVNVSDEQREEVEYSVVPITELRSAPEGMRDVVCHLRAKPWNEYQGRWLRWQMNKSMDRLRDREDFEKAEEFMESSSGWRHEEVEEEILPQEEEVPLIKHDCINAVFVERYGDVLDGEEVRLLREGDGWIILRKGLDGEDVGGELFKCDYWSTGFYRMVDGYGVQFIKSEEVRGEL